MLECQVCGVKRKFLVQHTNAEHNMTTDQYKEMFPGFKMGVGRVGKPAWSRGLTKETDERLAKSAIKTSKTMKGNYIPHNIGKTYDEIYDKEKSIRIKKAQSLGSKGNKHRLGKLSSRKGITNKKEYGEEKAKNIRDRISKTTIQNYRDYPELLELARENGKKGMRTVALKKRTYIEEQIKQILDKNDIQYIEQYTIKLYGLMNRVYRQIDFCIPEIKLFIEADGENWHDPEYDRKLDIAIKEKFGYDTIRYTGSQINTMTSLVEDSINKIILQKQVMDCAI